MLQEYFGRHRGADWLGRAAWSPRTKSAYCERFTLIAQDPKHPRTLLVMLSITQKPGPNGMQTLATATAVFDDGVAGTQKLAEESWPMDRARIDPDRPGLGLGECFVGDGSTQGLIHSGEFALSWALEAPFLGLPKNLLGHDSYYEGNKIGPKVALTVPSATVTLGHLEIWHTQGRYAQKTRLDCTGWQVHQSHVFGAGSPSAFVHVHVPPSGLALGQTSLDLFCLRTKVLGIIPTTLFVGCLNLPDKQPLARTWRYGGALPTPQQASIPWQFTVSHSGATWRGEVLANPARVLKTHGAPHHAAYALGFGVTVRASITTADGDMQTLISDQAVVEVGGGVTPS